MYMHMNVTHLSNTICPRETNMRVNLLNTVNIGILRERERQRERETESDCIIVRTLNVNLLFGI